MRWLALVGRILVGGGFVFAALMYFLGTMPAQPDLPEPAKQLGGVLGSSGWMTAVKVLELVGGALILSGRFAPLGLVLATPVAVNIALWDVCLLGKPGPGVVLTVLCFLLVGYYWSHFKGVFAPAKWV